MDARVDPEILAKTGAELFRELLRVYAPAEVDDYCKQGVWKDDQMRIDIQLFYQHAREAGAPEPPPLEEVRIPEAKAISAGIAGILLPATVTGGARPSNPSGASVVKPPAVGPAADLRAIAQLSSKYGLDPARTKAMLDKLTPERRRLVLQSFKTTATDREAAMVALQTFVGNLVATVSWQATVPAASSSVMPGVLPSVPVAAGPIWPGTAPGAAAMALAAGQLKRPPEPVLPPNKRPALATAALAPKSAAMAVGVLPGVALPKSATSQAW